MAQDSKRKRRERRLKRQRNIALRLVDLVAKQRDEARAMAKYMIDQYEEKNGPVEAPKGEMTIKKIENLEEVKEQPVDEHIPA